MSTIQAIAYLVTAVLFIVGVMRLRQPSTARSGNTLSAIGMLLALLVTIWGSAAHLALILGGIVVGGIVGAVAGRRVAMTAMPQMVALFNGMGGGAAALVALGTAVRPSAGAGTDMVALLTILIGAVSFAGSLVAFLKLNEWMTGRPVIFAGQRVLNAAIFVLLIVDGGLLTTHVWGPAGALGGFAVGAAVLGVLGVLPIGGGDMPVIISLLNSFTGLAAAATGFLLGNNVLIVAGALVGASGTILTQLMSRAMNRPLSNVLFGTFGRLQTSAMEAGADGVVQSTTAEDVAILLAYARRVVIVPGYGLAVARAQQEVRELADKLEARGVDVRFAIHPVAGRMPGHMNVLLAEANVSYQKLYDMDAINPEFARTDVVLVVGANDVTNPAARGNPNSPIYGMPILNVDQAERVIVLKRSMSPGFSGIDNALYLNPKTRMLFGDARASLLELERSLDEVA